MSDLNTSKSDQIRVLRQTLEGNGPFREAVSKLKSMTTGPDEPRFSPIFGSFARFIEMRDVESSAYEIQTRQANRLLDAERNDHLSLRGQITGSLAKGAFRLVLQPADVGAMARLRAAFDKVQLGQRQQMKGVEITQVFAEIKPITFDPELTIEEILEVLNESSSRNLYQITPVPYLLESTIPRSALRPGPQTTPHPKGDSYPEKQAS